MCVWAESNTHISLYLHLRADHRMTHHWESDLSFFVSEIGFDTVVNLCTASRFFEEIPQREREKRNTLLTDVWCKDKDKRPRWRMATFNKLSSQKHPLWRTTRRELIQKSQLATWTMKESSSENNPQYDALILCSWSRVWKEAWTEWLSVLQVVILIFFAILKLTWTTLRLKSHTCSYWYVSHTGLPGGASFFWLESSLAKMGGVGKRNRARETTWSELYFHRNKIHTCTLIALKK